MIFELPLLQEKLDLVISNGTIFDGVRSTSIRADIGILDKRILAIGDLSDCRRRESIDATNLYVCPGFIDVHTHDDLAVLETPNLPCKVQQGVTTVVVGNCGVSLAPIIPDKDLPTAPFAFLGNREKYKFSSVKEYFSAIKIAAPTVNVVKLVGHTTLRAATMSEFDRPATETEIWCMKEILDKSLSEGAVGMSTGLAYPPAFLAPTREVVELAKVVGEKNGLYVTHIRDEADGVIEAVEEAISIAGNSHSALIISHHKCIGKDNWGKSEKTLNIIENYSKNNKVAFDVYPYTASSTAILPHKVRFAERVVVTESAPYPQMAGRDISSISQEWNCSDEETAAALMPAKGIYFNMSEDDLIRILKHPLSMVASDGMPSDTTPHPRLWGTFPRLFRRYVNDLKILSFADALKKVTSVPAQTFGIKERGVIKEGNFADIVILDHLQIADNATFETPTLPPSGIKTVLFEGSIVHSSI